jgi:hypothetical protein
VVTEEVMRVPVLTLDDGIDFGGEQSARHGF